MDCHPNLTFTVDLFRQKILQSSFIGAVLKISLMSHRQIMSSVSLPHFCLGDGCSASPDFYVNDRELFTFPMWHHMGRTCPNGTFGRWRGPNSFFRCILAFQQELAACAMTEFIRRVVSYTVKWMYGTNPTVCLRYLLQFCEISPFFTVVWKTHMLSLEGVDAPCGKIQELV